MTETKKLSGRIMDLEGENEKLIQEIKRYERTLADRYAAGQDTSDLIGKISENKIKISGQTGALKSLDLKLFALQKEEHTTAAEQLDRETRGKFEAAVKSSVEALRPLEKGLLPIVGQGGIKDLAERILTSVKEIVWNSLDAEASELYPVRVPPLPQVPLQRDPDGRRIPGTSISRKDLSA